MESGRHESLMDRIREKVKENGKLIEESSTFAEQTNIVVKTL